MGFDNVQKNVHKKHQSQDANSKFLLRTMTYAVGHRTPSLTKNDDVTLPCTNITATAFLPSPSDWDDAKHRMEILVQRIVVEHIPALKNIR